MTQRTIFHARVEKLIGSVITSVEYNLVRVWKTNTCYYTYLETPLFQEEETNLVEGAEHNTVGKKNISQSATFLEFEK